MKKKNESKIKIVGVMIAIVLSTIFLAGSKILFGQSMIPFARSMIQKIVKCPEKQGENAEGGFIKLFICESKNEKHEDTSEKDESMIEKHDAIKEKLESMSLEEKIAQMLIVQPEGLGISEEEVERLKTMPFGGYILMENNYGTVAETREFVDRLQSNSKTVLIISTDDEGGRVRRTENLKDVELVEIPPMLEIGETGDRSLAEKTGETLAEELKIIGVNLDYAPDADVYSTPWNPIIGDRSFSDDPEVVAEMAVSLAKGLEKKGVSATYKHFPGHGDTEVDSHVSLPIIYKTREELEEVELVPFRAAIEADARAIMVGHIALPLVTGDNTPATLSATITTGILREEMGFRGLIITDALNMGALVENYSEEEIYSRAVEAGADLLLMPQNPELAIRTIKEKISEDRINESVYRILEFKEKYL